MRRLRKGDPHGIEKILAGCYALVGDGLADPVRVTDQDCVFAHFHRSLVPAPIPLRRVPLHPPPGYVTS